MLPSQFPPEPPSKSPPLPSEQRPLAYEQQYLCPICRHGQLTSLTLMDAFACDFCRHIFTANLTEQLLRVEDSSQPMAWRWNGRTWQSLLQLDSDLTWLVWLFCLGLAVLPPAIVWLPVHTFPPLEGSPAAWLPGVWVILTLVVHGIMSLWLLGEHYQWAPYLAWKVRLRQWLWS